MDPEKHLTIKFLRYLSRVTANNAYDKDADLVKQKLLKQDKNPYSHLSSRCLETIEQMQKDFSNQPPTEQHDFSYYSSLILQQQPKLK